MNEPRTPEYFERLYTRDPDPWCFATSDYEHGKYAATLAALPHPHYARAFEVGCSIGVLTRQLAARCTEVLAVDVAGAALRQAETRCADLPGVTFANMVIPGQWPAGTFDLMIYSEVIYYFSPEGRRDAAGRSVQSLRPGGAIMLVNWHGPIDDVGPIDSGGTGDASAEEFIAAVAPTLRPILQQRAEKYRLDVLA